MDDLATRMRAAADSPPPSRIDLDTLISGELRRRRTLRWAGGTAAVAAAVTLAVGVPVMLPGARSNSGPDSVAVGTSDPARSARPCPTASAPGPQQSHPAPRPAEGCGEAVDRLAAELTAALRRSLTGASASGVTTGPVEFVYLPVRLRYTTTVTVSGPNGNGHLRLDLIASHERPTREQTDCPDDSCRYETDPDGTVVVAHGVGQQVQVTVYRPDGTALLAVAYPAAKEPTARSPLTLDQVIAIARTPGLTLFP